MNEVLAFHRTLPGYAPTPLVDGWIKDETRRLGLPAFKILGASWALERAVTPETELVVAASAGNHGRAVARAARWRGLACRVYLPERSLEVRRTAIAEEGAEVVVGGTYEDCVAAAEADVEGVLIADVGSSHCAYDVIDGYSTLFVEIDVDCDAVVVPVGVGSLCAAAVRWARPRGVRVVAVEPENAACLAAALDAGRPVRIDTPGTVMAGMDCAEVSVAAWPDLQAVDEVQLVGDAELPAGFSRLERSGVDGGECAAAAVVAAGRVAGRVIAIATEGPTGRTHREPE